MLFFNQAIFLHGFTKELAPSVEAICSSQCVSLTSQVRSSWATQWIQVSHPRRLWSSSPSTTKLHKVLHKQRTRLTEQHNSFHIALMKKVRYYISNWEINQVNYCWFGSVLAMGFAYILYWVFRVLIFFLILLMSMNSYKMVRFCMQKTVGVSGSRIFLIMLIWSPVKITHLLRCKIGMAKFCSEISEFQ